MGGISNGTGCECVGRIQTQRCGQVLQVGKAVYAKAQGQESSPGRHKSPGRGRPTPLSCRKMGQRSGEPCQWPSWEGAQGTGIGV